MRRCYEWAAAHLCRHCAVQPWHQSIWKETITKTLSVGDQALCKSYLCHAFQVGCSIKHDCKSCMGFIGGLLDVPKAPTQVNDVELTSSKLQGHSGRTAEVQKVRAYLQIFCEEASVNCFHGIFNSWGRHYVCSCQRDNRVSCSDWLTGKQRRKEPRDGAQVNDSTGRTRGTLLRASISSVFELP